MDLVLFLLCLVFHGMYIKTTMNRNAKDQLAAILLSGMLQLFGLAYQEQNQLGELKK